MTYNSDALFTALRPALHARRFVVALSGGLDSIVLLHSLLTLPLSQKLIALHVNHQLSPSADDWEQFCRTTCDDLGVDFFARTVAVEKNGSGLEDAARNARYDEFAEFLESGDCLLTAHHQNDQAETFLLRLMRGSGPRGLSGMPLSRQVGDAYVFRPLLNYPRRALMNYAEKNNLGWIDDESNDDQAFDRNFIRKTILSPLKKRWPAMLGNITRSARLSQEAEELSRELAAIDLFACYPRQERWGLSMALPYLRGCSRVRQKNIVRFWLEENDLPMPGQARLEEIVDAVIHAAEGASPVVSWSGMDCRRFQERLYLVATPHPFDASAEYLFSTGDILSVDGVGEISLTAEMGEGLLLNKDDKLCIRFRQGGERCQPEERQHSQTLKKLLQEYHVPPWVRDRVPLVYVNGDLAAVGDFWINQGFTVAEARQRGFVVRCYFDFQSGTDDEC